MIAARRQLGTAFFMHANVAGGGAVWVAQVEVDSIAIGSAACPAGARRGADGVLATCCEEKANPGEDDQTDQTASHGFLCKKRQGRQQNVDGSVGIAMPLPSPPPGEHTPGK